MSMLTAWRAALTTITEDFVWVAHLDDGSTYPEYDVRGEARGWASVPHERVVAIELEPQHAGLPAPNVRIPRGHTPVFFRRRQLTISMTDGATKASRTITVVGWESPTESRYWAIYPDGTSLLTTDTAAIE